MTAVNKVWQLLFGKPLDPLDPRTRHAIAVTPILAWVGLGADGLSSSCYGPEEAFLALGQHTPLALFLAVATASMVFVIALGYNQVIELFPTGGGGYRVATALLGPRPRLVSGAALLMRAFSLGGGTYTGLEAASNNVNMPAEPRVPAGKTTMFYMATSLAFTAGGIILLYMLWHAKPAEGQTLNAVVFGSVIDHLGLGSAFARHALLAAVLAFEAGLLLVGAQTGFLDGPAVLSNMAGDSWVPRHFRDLSTRLVRQNGIVVMGVSSLAILMWTHGNVDILVVLYSINVFLTFSLSLLGLCTWLIPGPLSARIR